MSNDQSSGTVECYPVLSTHTRPLTLTATGMNRQQGSYPYNGPRSDVITPFVVLAFLAVTVKWGCRGELEKNLSAD